MLNGKLHEKRIYPGARHKSLESNTAVGIPKDKRTELFSLKMTFLRHIQDAVTIGSLYSCPNDECIPASVSADI